MRNLRLGFLLIALFGLTAIGFSQQSAWPASASQTAAQFSGCSVSTPYLTQSGACAASSAATQRGVNAVGDWGLDNTGASDVSATFSTKVNALTAGTEIYFPCGLYKFTNGVVFSATNSGLAGIALIGEGTSSFAGGAATGSGCVYFEYNGGGANPDLMWWKNTSADTTNDNGPRIENINFVDTSGTGAVHSLIRISQFSNWIIRNDGFQNAAGKQYTTGTVTVTNGSATVTGSGTAWVTAVLPQYGTDFQVAGHLVEVASFNSDTSLTLTSPWSYATASGAAYAVDYNGIDVLLEGNSQGSNSYTQYGTLEDIHAYSFREFAHLQGSPGGVSSGGGAYDITFDGGWIQCGRVTDSEALFFGAFDGSFSVTNQKFQNCARIVTSEGAQAATYTFRYENTGAYTPVTTCNGGVAAQSCTAGIVFNNNGNATLGTKVKIIGSNIVQTGNAIEFDAMTAGHPVQIIGNGFTSNTNNYAWSNGTTGCNATETDALVIQSDCLIGINGTIVNNGISWVVGAGAPSGACTTGSIYSNSSGGAGTSLYGCKSGTWTDIL